MEINQNGILTKIYRKDERKKILYQHIIGMRKNMMQGWTTGQRKVKQRAKFHSLINQEMVLLQKRMGTDFVL